jgi:hypothetical protein
MTSASPSFSSSLPCSPSSRSTLTLDCVSGRRGRRPPLSSNVVVLIHASAPQVPPPPSVTPPLSPADFPAVISSSSPVRTPPAPRSPDLHLVVSNPFSWDPDLGPPGWSSPCRPLGMDASVG